MRVKHHHGRENSRPLCPVEQLLSKQEVLSGSRFCEAEGSRHRRTLRQRFGLHAWVGKGPLSRLALGSHPDGAPSPAEGV